MSRGQTKEEEEVAAGERMASENASAGRTSAEMLVKGKYSGLGMPASKMTIRTSVKQKDHLPPAKVIMSLSKYFWRSLSGEGAYLRTWSERWWDRSTALVHFSEGMMGESRVSCSAYTRAEGGLLA